MEHNTNQPAPSAVGQTSLPLTFGLDIGIASVGWAVINPERIVALGVRAFNKAETDEKGESRNLARRSARLLRRRLYRRAWRLVKLSRVLKRFDLIDDLAHFKQQPGFADSTWQLRVEALDRMLAPQELARVLYHLCKHRGFHWVSKAEEKAAESDAKEGGKVIQALKQTRQLIDSKKYRTAAEMLLAEFPHAQRNKGGDYSKAISRVLLDEELVAIFAAQRKHGSPFASSGLESAVRGESGSRGGLFWAQKPALAGKDLLKMLGFCTFEKGEHRAPKASFSAERHVWLTRLNNIRIMFDGQTRALNELERRASIHLPYQGPDPFKYKDLRNALVKAGLWTDAYKFAGMGYASQSAEGKPKNPEDDTLVKMPAWHELRKEFTKHGLGSEWLKISTAALEGRPELLDSIGWVLSVFKDDAEVQTELEKLKLPGGQATINCLQGVRFDKFHALSLKALRNIVPHMARGLRYDEAVAQIEAYGHHSQRFVAGSGKHTYLPAFYESARDKNGGMVFAKDLDAPRNPVVLRALNQARKVVNALIRTYGAPFAVHIELARDLSRPIKERREIKSLQDEYRDRNEAARDQFQKDFSRQPKGAEFDKWLLYREQHGKCAYSLQPMDIERVVNDKGYVEIDHALPRSRSFDHSKNNKVLVLARENQNKGNRTPYEYLDGATDSARWHEFVSWVEGNKSYRQAKRSRLLRKNFSADEASGFRDRNLNDTRFICKFFKAFVEEHLQLAAGSESKRCVVVNGQLTSFLRTRWGLPKDRSASDRHHALDAAVVAACSHAMVKRLADHSRRKELALLREGFPDPETGEIINPDAHRVGVDHFPEPWAHFRHELMARLHTDDVAALREDLARLGTYDAQALGGVNPLFVSRAPQRRNTGAVHKETIYARPKTGHVLMVKDKTKEGVAIQRPATPQEKANLAIVRMGVADKDMQGKYKFTQEKLADIVDARRNAKMVFALEQWIEGREARDMEVKRIEALRGRGTERRALTADEQTRINELQSLPRKPLVSDPEHGPFSGPIIRAVKLNGGPQTGVNIRGGVAANDSMIRVDVFTKAGKFHLVPVYVHHVVSGLPNRAIVQKKDESEWTIIDDSFAFKFSMQANDLIRVQQKNKPQVVGYFGGCHRGAETIGLWAHDRNANLWPEGKWDGGIKTALSVEKLNVDLLGNIYPAPPETRRGLA